MLLEYLKVVQIVLQHFIKDYCIYFPVEMHEAISHSRHFLGSVGELLSDDSVLGQHNETVCVGLGRSEPFTGDDVISHVDAAFDGNLQVVWMRSFSSVSWETWASSWS